MADDDVSERKGPASISAPQDAFIDILNNTDKRRTKGFVVIAKGAESLQVAAFLKTARTRHGADAWGCRSSRGSHAEFRGRDRLRPPRITAADPRTRKLSRDAPADHALSSCVPGRAPPRPLLLL